MTKTSANPVSIKSLTSYRIRLIAEKIGLEATFELLDKHWVDTLYIPDNLSRSKLADKIGFEAAKALVELWPNQSITLPKPDKILQQWRNYELLAQTADGTLTTKEASIKYGLTRQRINQIKHDNQENPNLSLDLTL